MGVLTLDGLSIDAAVELAKRSLDATFVIHLGRQKALMISDGLSRDDIEGLLERQLGFYLVDREQHLDELKSWLFALARKLH